MKNKLPRKYRIISRVCRSDAPENLASSRYAGMHNGDAGDTKTAKTLVLSGFAGGLSKPRAGFAHTVCSHTWEPAKGGRPLLRHPATRMCALHSNCHLAGWTQSTLTPWKPAKGGRPPLRHPATRMCALHSNFYLAGSQTKNRHKLRLTCVFIMQKK